MEWLIESGKTVGVLSNSTRLAQKEVDKVASYGLYQGKHFHFYITSGEIAKEMFVQKSLPFETPRKKIWVFGGDHPRFSSSRMLFEGSQYEETSKIQEADFIYLAIPHLEGEDQVDPKVFLEALRAVQKRGIPMLCANPDRFAHEGNPPKAVVRQGSLAALFKDLGGEVFYVGKPSPLAYCAAMKRFALLDVFNPKEVLMIGDTPEIDIRGAQNSGMASALVTQTGVMADRINQYGLQNVVLEDSPDFLIERFAIHEFHTPS